MSRLGLVSTEHPMLYVIKGVVLASDAVIKGLLFPANKVAYSRQHTALTLRFSLRDHFEECVHVHALVYV